MPRHLSYQRSYPATRRAQTCHVKLSSVRRGQPPPARSINQHPVRGFVLQQRGILVSAVVAVIIIIVVAVFIVGIVVKRHQVS